MRIKLLLWIGSVSLALGCSTGSVYTIRFCENKQMDACEPEKKQFTLGERIYVKLVTDRAFESDKITGTVYKLIDQEKFKMGTKDFVVSEEDSFILQDIPFDEYGMQALGTFEISFTNSQGQIIASKQLKIIQP